MSDMSLSDSAPRISGNAIKWVFCAVIFLSACLLFFIQPLFTRMVLPTIGGAPAVWTTAMLFFQTVLLAGYIYAHLVVKHVPAKAQIWLHLTLWGLALLFLPLGMPDGWQPDPERSAVGQTLILYALGVGVPFAFLSANAPLIQSWYRRSGGPSAEDPYFLYGASNLGSMGALIGFTLLAEPMLGVAAQAGAWSLGFGLLGVGFAGLAMVLTRAKAAGIAAPIDTTETTPRARISLDQMSRWLILAFVPSSLMLSVTTKISTDLGNLPLFWVLPLVIYLLTFVATFTHRPWISDTLLRLSILPAIGAGIYCYHQLTLAPLLALVPIFAVVTLYAHRRLYQARPAAENLTLFYVIMSIGGAAGGLFNSVVAPLAFDSLFEGTATFLLAIAMLFFVSATHGPVPATWHRYVALGGAGIAIAAVMTEFVWLDVAVVAGVLLAALVFLPRPVSLVTAVIAVTGLGTLWQHPDALFQDRSFFGTHKVLDLNAKGVRAYVNGTTAHGYLALTELEAQTPTPLSYYHPNGPMAEVLTSDHLDATASVGIVGLGVGALSCYRQPGQDWHFYEIDPMVDRVARNPDLFTYMSNCSGDAPTHLGDARVVLDGQTELTFDALVIDAYSSNSVPVHLTTADAMQLYMDRLADDGVLIYHISNRYYRIDVPLARAAEALNLDIWIKFHEANARAPFEGDTLVAMVTRDGQTPQTILDKGGWILMDSDGGKVWTDDFANPLGSLKWIYDR